MPSCFVSGAQEDFEMEKSLGLVSQFMFSLVLVAAFSAGTFARGEAKPSPSQRQAAQSKNALSKTALSKTAPSKSSLPESTVLMQHDDVLPTQNRSHAMAIEAETGHLPSAEEQELNRRGFKKEVNADHR